MSGSVFSTPGSADLNRGGGWTHRLPGDPNQLGAWRPGHLTSLHPLQAKHLASQYWGSGHPAAVRRDPSLPYLEQYRIDASHFRELFASLAPWACGSHTPVLAGRMFRLLDKNKDSLINFKEFVTGMSEWLQGPSVPSPFLNKPPNASPGQSSHCSKQRAAQSPWPLIREGSFLTGDTWGSSGGPSLHQGLQAPEKGEAQGKAGGPGLAPGSSLEGVRLWGMFPQIPLEGRGWEVGKPQALAPSCQRALLSGLPLQVGCTMGT